eukprot:CAMPEP_0171241934 /NCGR_PEP_ID=MMETSP0790-20130122/45375_1 /TAXON_ID=2925 /ORGANISM="Alexandrium catenella, Strain OF101" /LENGTH=42 /DNA_ID= /DNA_START= /DNA_END= /DNA_ORIENTATION=
MAKPSQWNLRLQARLNSVLNAALAMTGWQAPWGLRKRRDQKK